MSTSLSLESKRGIVLGIASRHSIACGIAEVLSEQGAELCITYLNEKSKPFVVPLVSAHPEIGIFHENITLRN
jgi:enoyl-[acyl-carrier protein] reductase I